jgi:antitoxin YefM
MYSILYSEGIPVDAISYTNLRQNLKSYMDKVFQDHEPLIITRKNNENVVLMSLDEYNSLMETNYLLSSKTNAEHLQKSIGQHKSGKIRERTIYENE